MLKRLRGLFSNDLSIDLGTANTLVYVKERGIILDEPSVVAIRNNQGQRTVVAVGAEAKKMLGRTPGNITAIRPLKDGVIADFQAAEHMIRGMIKMMKGGSRYIQPTMRMVICIPSGITEVEKRAVQDSAEHAGGKEVYLIHEPMAAAIGIGVDVEEPMGNMIIDITNELESEGINTVSYTHLTLPTKRIV